MTQLPRSVHPRRFASALMAVALCAGCNAIDVNTPTRSLNGPSDVALSCVQASPLDRAVYDVHPIEDCSPDRMGTPSEPGPVVFQGPEVDSNNNPIVYFPILRALVTNEERGELALVEILNSSIINLNIKLPGYNFLPVGDLPERVRISADGCQAITANVDSCDMALVDVSVLHNMSRINQIVDSGLPTGSAVNTPAYVDNVVHRLAPTINGVPLRARPSWVEFAPENTPALHSYEVNAAGERGLPGQCIGGKYSAWVALPNCQMVVEVSLSATEYNSNNVIPAEVQRAIQFTPSGLSIITDPSTISCPVECGGEELASPSPSPVSSPGATPAARSWPSSLAFDFDTGASRLFISDSLGEKIGVVPLLENGVSLGEPHTISLVPGALGVDVVRVSQRTPAGKFIYAVARDSSVRVIDVDRETECETNPDPRYFQSVALPDPSTKARYFGCFPIGDPATPPRSPLVPSPGIQLATGVLPRDVMFVHVNEPSGQASNESPPAAGPATPVGDYAWILGSDGHVNMVNIYDACPQPNIPILRADGTYSPACSLDPEVIASSRNTSFTNPGNPVPTENALISHRLRGGSSLFYLPPDIEDNVGQPRLQDETIPFTVAVNGLVAGSGIGADAGAEILTLPSMYQGYVAVPPGYATPPARYTRHIAFFDPDRVQSETWEVAWEGQLPNTARSQGVLTSGQLVDAAAQFCQHDVLPGDKMYLDGCTDDDQCDYTQTCYHDPASPSDVTSGLCISNQGSSDQQKQRYAECGPLLRALRRYRIVDVKQSWPLPPTNEVTSYLKLAEVYEPEHAADTVTCQADADCGSVKVDGLPTACASDWDGQLRCLVTCTATDTDSALCGTDYQCVKSQRTDHPYRCLRAPLDATLFQDCLPERQNYEVRAADSFLVTGSQSGVYLNVQVNGATGSCEVQPPTSEYTRLRNPRLPLAPPACPASLVDPLNALDVSSPLSSCVMTVPGGVGPDADPQTVLHYENPTLAIGLIAPAVPPDYTVLQFVVIGGAFTESLLMQIDTPAQLLKTGVVAPDQETVYVVDEGRQSVGTGLQGELYRFFSQLTQVDTNFIVR